MLLPQAREPKGRNLESEVIRLRVRVNELELLLVSLEARVADLEP
jgi:hypothetical protein